MRRVASVVTGVAAVLTWATMASASQIELVTNGNFEVGTLAGWTVNDLAGGSGTFSFDTPGTTTPISAHPTLSTAANGTGYAVSDQLGPGTHALRQTINVSTSYSVILTFDMFANDWDSGPIFGGQGLNHVGAANQFARVDLLTAGATAFDTGAGVVSNFFNGVDGGADPNAFTHYSIDITSLVGAGGTFQLRFAETDNQLYFNLGVDNVSVLATPVPEPMSLVLLGTGMIGLGSRRMRRRATKKQ